jgi:hypothetical protein
LSTLELFLDLRDFLVSLGQYECDILQLLVLVDYFFLSPFNLISESLHLHYLLCTLLLQILIEYVIEPEYVLILLSEVPLGLLLELVELPHEYLVLTLDLIL